MSAARALFFFLPLAWLLAAPGSAQTPRIAALQHRIAASPNPTDALRYSVELLGEHESLQKDSLAQLAAHTLFLARRTGDERAADYACLGFINYALRSGASKKADSILRVLLPRYRDARGDDLPLCFDLRFARVAVIAGRGAYEEATAELFSTIRAAEKRGYTPAVARAYNELGVISYNLDRLDQAIAYYRKVLALGTAHTDAGRAQAYAYINLAQAYAWREQFDSAHHYISLAKPICARIQNLYYLANAWLIESNTCKWEGRMRAAEDAMQEMVALRTRTEGRISFSNEQLGLANLYVQTKSLDRAIATYKDGLTTADSLRASGAPLAELELRYHEGLARAYNATDNRDAYEAELLTVFHLKDSVYAQSSAAAIAEMETKYETEKKELTIARQRLDIVRKNYLFYGSLAVLGAGGIVGYGAFKNYRRKQRLRLAAARAEEQLGARVAVAEAEEKERARIAADLHDNLGAYAASITSSIERIGSEATLPPSTALAFDALRGSARYMVADLADTIWAMRGPALRLTAISDRLKTFLQRIAPSHTGVLMDVEEELEDDPMLTSVQAYHLLKILQEAITNALRHSGGNRVVVVFSAAGDGWSVMVEDDGRGLRRDGVSAPAPAVASMGGNGLHSMGARAAEMGWRLEITTRESGVGTRAVVYATPTSN